MLLKGYTYSKVLEMDTSITVLSPGSKADPGPYKVAYLLHGLCGNSENWTDNTMLPVYAQEHNILFVMPEVARSFYTDLKYGQRFFTFITEELPKICKEHFNISHKAEDTIVMGGSMGGYGALKCAFTYPDRYGSALAFSSACLFMKDFLEVQKNTIEAQGPAKLELLYGRQFVNDFRAMFGDDLSWDPGSEILHLAEKAARQETRPVVYTSCGTSDTLLAENRAFAKRMQILDFDFTFEEFPGDHDWYHFNDALKKGLNWLKEKSF